MPRHKRLKGKRTRLNIELPKGAYDALQNLVRLTEAGSSTEAIRTALYTTNYLAVEIGNGSKIFIDRQNGEYLELIIPKVSNVVPNASCE